MSNADFEAYWSYTNNRNWFKGRVDKGVPITLDDLLLCRRIFAAYSSCRFLFSSTGKIAKAPCLASNSKSLLAPHVFSFLSAFCAASSRDQSFKNMNRFFGMSGVTMSRSPYFGLTISYFVVPNSLKNRFLLTLLPSNHHVEPSGCASSICNQFAAKYVFPVWPTSRSA